MRNAIVLSLLLILSTMSPASTVETAPRLRISEAIRLLSESQTEAALALLTRLCKESDNEAERLDAAVLLSAAPMGSSAYAERATYAHFARQHPLFGSRLDPVERNRLLRAEGLGWFSQSRWEQAIEPLAILSHEGTAGDQAFAELYLGWIEINQNKPQNAFKRWMDLLGKKEAAVPQEWRLPMIRDLGQAWVESGGISLQAVHPMQLLLSSEEEQSYLASGIKTGLQTISHDQALWNKFRINSSSPFARIWVEPILLQDSLLLSGRPCELLTRSRPQAEPGTPALSHLNAARLSANLIACWSSGEANSAEDRQVLLALLNQLGLQGQDRWRIAEINESLEQWNQACAEYLTIVSKAPTRESTTVLARACKKADGKAWEQLVASVPFNNPLFTPVIDLVFARTPDFSARQALLEKAFPSPSQVSEGELSRRAAAWWLQALQDDAGQLKLSPTRLSWTKAFLESPALWKHLKLSSENQMLVKLQMSLSSGLILPLWAHTAEIEAAAVNRNPRLSNAYFTWLDHALEAYQGQQIELPAQASNSLAANLRNALTEIRAGLQPDLSRLTASKLQVLRVARAKCRIAAAIENYAMASPHFEKAHKVSLNLNAPRLAQRFRRYLSLAHEGVQALRKSAAVFPTFQPMIQKELTQQVQGLQDQVSKIQAPEAWSQGDRTAWNEQQVQLIAQLADWRLL